MMNNAFYRSHIVELPYQNKIIVDIKRVIEVLDIDGINSKQIAKTMLRQTLSVIDDQTN